MGNLGKALLAYFVLVILLAGIIFFLGALIHVFTNIYMAGWRSILNW